MGFNHLNAELNPICHFLVLLGAHHILHVSRIRVNYLFRHHIYVCIEIRSGLCDSYRVSVSISVNGDMCPDILTPSSAFRIINTICWKTSQYERVSMELTKPPVMRKSSSSWVKRDQLDITCFIISLFNVQHVSDVNTCILRSLRLVCWVISWVVLLWFDVCWC